MPSILRSNIALALIPLTLVLAISCSQRDRNVSRLSTLQNFAEGQPATQSSTAYGGSAARAVDGKTNGAFGAGSVTHTGSNRTAWWEVDLGQTISIATIAIWGRTDCCTDRLSNFYVLVSRDPFTSTSLSETLQQPGVRSFQIAGQAHTPSEEITIGATGRYVRVQLAGTNYLALAEVQVFGQLEAAPDMSFCGACGSTASGSCAPLEKGATPTGADCAGWLCDGTTDACPAACSSDDSCSSGYTCKKGSCTAQSQGLPCTGAADCQSGFCVQGVCCNSACTGDCSACSVALGAAEDGVCANVAGAGNCGAYLCNGSRASCPTDCASDDACTNAAVCTDGRCACRYGYCAKTGECLSPGECCTDSDCIYAPDWCHTVAGATCNAGVCSFPVKQCPSGAACTDAVRGTCDQAPITLTVTPSAASYDDSPYIFEDGTVHFTATLTNVSAAPIAVSNFNPGNISITSLTRNGAPLAPRTSPTESLYDYRVIAAQAVTIGPSASTSFPIPSVAALAITRGNVQTQLQYDNAGPGTYLVTFTYQYSGSNAQAYKGIVTAAPVAFIVQ
jgi:hypothetical protein